MIKYNVSLKKQIIVNSMTFGWSLSSILLYWDIKNTDLKHTVHCILLERQEIQRPEKMGGEGRVNNVPRVSTA